MMTLELIGGSEEEMIGQVWKNRRNSLLSGERAGAEETVVEEEE